MTIAASDVTLGYVDEANVYYYDAAWRLLEERVDEGRFAPGTQPSEEDPFDGLTFAADRVVQRVWGLEYIDELLFVMEDDDEDMTDGTPSGHHAVVDRLYSVVGLLDEDAVLLERVRYSAYGVARQHSVALADVNGDGVTSAADLNSVNSAFGLTLADANYNADADFDGNGVIDFGNDYNAVLSGFGEVGAPAGQVSQEGNTVGYAGYLFDPATGMCLARFRWYEPEIGRWATRDPTIYYDSMDLYEYVSSGVPNSLDPLGLWKIDWKGPWTPEEKRKVEDSLERLKNRIRDLRCQLKNLRDSLSPCVKKELQKDLDDLQNRLDGINDGLNSDKPLRMRQADLGPEDGGQTDKVGLVGQHIRVRLNTGVQLDWRKLDAALLDMLLMHELAHVDEFQKGEPDMDGRDTLNAPDWMQHLAPPGVSLPKIGRVDWKLNAAKRKCNEN